jgi:uncharacterized protein
MNPSPRVEPTLTRVEREILARTLAPFAYRIERVAVFGSRATGLARPNSDIDLVLYGDVDSELEGRIWTLLDDSQLAVPVDVVAYAMIRHEGLKRHIDTTAVVVFEAKDLLANAS